MNWTATASEQVTRWSVDSCCSCSADGRVKGKHQGYQTLNPSKHFLIELKASRSKSESVCCEKKQLKVGGHSKQRLMLNHTSACVERLQGWHCRLSWLRDTATSPQGAFNMQRNDSLAAACCIQFYGITRSTISTSSSLLNKQAIRAVMPDMRQK